MKKKTTTIRTIDDLYVMKYFNIEQLPCLDWLFICKRQYPEYAPLLKHGSYSHFRQSCSRIDASSYRPCLEDNQL